MYKLILCLCLFLGIDSYPQVGIGTETPQATLDVNGNVRIQTLEIGTPAAAKDSILITNGKQIIKRISAKQIVRNTFLSCVKSIGSGPISLAALSGITGWSKIVFNNEEFDANSDYDISVQEFTAPLEGVYSVYAQFRTTGLLSTGELGIGIFKKIGNATPVLIAQESYSQVSVNLPLVSVDVSPPVRKVQTLVQLNPGDKILFGLKRSSITGLTLIGGNDSYFTIHQVR